MRRIAMSTIAAATLVAVPAQASSDKAPKPDKPAKAGKCAPKAVGFNATGKLVSQALTQTAGAETPAERGDDRFSGTVTVMVTKANRKGAKGEQTFTLVNDRVKFHDADENGVADVPAAGDRVKVHGKVTRLKKSCDQTGFKPTVDVKKVGFKKATPTPAPGS